MPLAIVVALAINAPAQARFREEPLVQLSLFPQGHLGFKYVDFAAQVLRHFSGEFFRPLCIRSFHVADAPSSASWRRDGRACEVPIVTFIRQAPSVGEQDHGPGAPADFEEAGSAPGVNWVVTGPTPLVFV